MLCSGLIACRPGLFRCIARTGRLALPQKRQRLVKPVNHWFTATAESRLGTLHSWTCGFLIQLCVIIMPRELLLQRAPLGRHGNAKLGAILHLAVNFAACT